MHPLVPILLATVLPVSPVPGDGWSGRVTGGGVVTESEFQTRSVVGLGAEVSWRRGAFVFSSATGFSTLPDFRATPSGVFGPDDVSNGTPIVLSSVRLLPFRFSAEHSRLLGETVRLRWALETGVGIESGPTDTSLTLTGALPEAGRGLPEYAGPFSLGTRLSFEWTLVEDQLVASVRPGGSFRIIQPPKPEPFDPATGLGGFITSPIPPVAHAGATLALAGRVGSAVTWEWTVAYAASWVRGRSLGALGFSEPGLVRHDQNTIGLNIYLGLHEDLEARWSVVSTGLIRRGGGGLAPCNSTCTAGGTSIVTPPPSPTLDSILAGLTRRNESFQLSLAWRF